MVMTSLERDLLFTACLSSYTILQLASQGQVRPAYSNRATQPSLVGHPTMPSRTYWVVALRVVRRARIAKKVRLETDIECSGPNRKRL
jgi:hypothetical protein